MSTPTLKELCAKATPGPYHFYAKQRPRRSNFEGKFGAVYTGSVGAGSGMDATKVCELKGANEVLANAQLIARLSPEVMMKVYEALTLVDLAFTRMNYGNPELMGDDEFEAWKAINESLRLLDGKPEATP